MFPNERVARILADEPAARTSVRDRLDIYERLWDGGCGCKVECYR